MSVSVSVYLGKGLFAILLNRFRECVCKNAKKKETRTAPLREAVAPMEAMEEAILLARVSRY